MPGEDGVGWRARGSFLGSAFNFHLSIRVLVTRCVRFGNSLSLVLLMCPFLDVC